MVAEDATFSYRDSNGAKAAGKITFDNDVLVLTANEVVRRFSVTLDGATLVATGVSGSSDLGGSPLRGKRPRPRARMSYSPSGGSSDELEELQQLEEATTEAIAYLSLPKPERPPRTLATIISSLAVELAFPLAGWVEMPVQSGELDQMRTELRDLQRQIAVRVAIEERLRAEAQDEDEALALLLA